MGATGAWVLRQRRPTVAAGAARGLPPIRVASICPRGAATTRYCGRSSRGHRDLAGDPSLGDRPRDHRGCAFRRLLSCVHALRLLRAAGIRIAIDDSVRASPRSAAVGAAIDTLKIDRVFTAPAIGPQEAARWSPRSSVWACVRHETVAEGVETQAQVGLPGARRLR